MRIEQVPRKIREENYSPFEAMIYIHKCLTSEIEILGDNKYFSFKLASLTQQIIDEINLDGLSSKIVHSTFFNKNLLLPINHYHNLIAIHDSKYHIYGKYANDIYADLKTQEYKTGKGFAHMLFPASDFMSLQQYFYKGHLAEKTECYNSYIKPPQHTKKGIQTEIPSYISDLDENDPIYLPVLISALKHIHLTAPEITNTKTFNDFVYDEISNSIETAKKTFNHSSKTKFVKCYESNKDSSSESQNS